LREYPLISAVDSEGDLASVLNRFFKQNEENGCLEPGQLSQENNKTPEIEDFEANSRRDVPNWADFERGMGQDFFFFFFCLHVIHTTEVNMLGMPDPGYISDLVATSSDPVPPMLDKGMLDLFFFSIMTSSKSYPFKLPMTTWMS
jgi:hypothetical protein